MEAGVGIGATVKNHAKCSHHSPLASSLSDPISKNRNGNRKKTGGDLVSPQTDAVARFIVAQICPGAKSQKAMPPCLFFF